MEKTFWADTNGLANVATGVCIFGMAPVLLGLATGESIIGSIPWMICAWPIAIISVIALLKNGDIVSGTANAILTCMALFNNVIHGLITLYVTENGVALSEETLNGMAMMDGFAYLASAIFLISIVFMSLKVNKVQALFLALPCLAFFLLFFQFTGIFSLGVLPGILIVIFGCWLIYSGMAMMMHTATKTEILPYIKK